MRRGTTLVELMVVLTLLGLLLSVTALAIRFPRGRVGSEEASGDRHAAQAIREGRPIVSPGDSGRAVLYLPDGRRVTDASGAGTP